MPTIAIYNKCNNRCLMCTNPEGYSCSREDFSYSALSRRVERFLQGSNEFLENFGDTFLLTGGEPTLSSDLPSYIKRISALFPNAKIKCITNGRLFSYATYTKKIITTRNNLGFIISLHGHNAKLHDKITQVKGSFEQSVSGLKNIFKFKTPHQDVEIRIVIHKLNYRYLEEISDFIQNNFSKINRLVYVFFEIEGMAYKNIGILEVMYTQLRTYLDKIFTLISGFPNTRLYHFPLCTVSPKFLPYVWRTLPEFEVDFLPVCKKCSLKRFCLGIHKGYLAYFGPHEFRAITRDIGITKTSNWHHPISRVKENI